VSKEHHAAVLHEAGDRLVRDDEHVVCVEVQRLFVPGSARQGRRVSVCQVGKQRRVLRCRAVTHSATSTAPLSSNTRQTTWLFRFGSGTAPGAGGGGDGAVGQLTGRSKCIGSGPARTHVEAGACAVVADLFDAAFVLLGQRMQDAGVEVLPHDVCVSAAAPSRVRVWTGACRRQAAKTDPLAKSCSWPGAAQLPGDTATAHRYKLAVVMSCVSLVLASSSPSCTGRREGSPPRPRPRQCARQLGRGRWRTCSCTNLISRSTTSRLYLLTPVSRSVGAPSLWALLPHARTHCKSSGAAFSFTQARLSSPR
jgi:hypothetical protein